MYLIRYALLAAPLALLGLPLYVFVPPRYAASPELGLWEVGIVFMLARFLDLITDPLVGRVVDGSRQYVHPWFWMLMGVPPTAIGVWLLFNPPDAVGVIWLVAVLSLTYFGWTLLSVPYFSWGSELANANIKHSSIAAARESGTLIGATAAVVMLGLMPGQPGLSLVSVLFLVLLGVALWAMRLLPRMALPVSGRVTGLWDSARHMRFLLYLYLLNALAAAIPGTLFVLFAEEILSLSPQTMGWVLIVYFASGVVGIPLWLSISRRFGLLRAWGWSMSLAAVSFVPVMFLETGDLWGFLAVCIATGLSLGADVALPAAAHSRLARKHSESLGVPVEGLAFGLWGMTGKVALALGVGLSFPILDIATHLGQREQGLLLLYGLLPIVIKLITLFLLRSWSSAIRQLMNMENDNVANSSEKALDISARTFARWVRSDGCQ